MKIVIKHDEMGKRKMKAMISRHSSSFDVYQNREEEDSHTFLCFFLGFIFGPFGLLVAAIIGKASGVKASLFGFCICIVICLFLFSRYF